MSLNFKNNVSYLLEKIIEELKALREYKVNFFLGILMSGVYSLMFVILFSALYENFTELIGWNFKEYVFFILIAGFNASIYGSFWFGQNLHYNLKRGILNVILTKPTNTFLTYMGVSLSAPFLANAIIVYFTSLIIFFIFFVDNFMLSRFVGLIVLSCFSGLFFILINRFIDSLNFFGKSRWILEFYRMFYSTFDRFPAQMFSGSKILLFPFFCANVYYGALSTEYFFGKISFEYYLSLLGILLVLIILIVLSLIIIWKIGLKNYEGFGG